MFIRRSVVAVAVVSMVGGCAANHAAAKPKVSHSASPSQSPSRTSSAFCLDLNDFQVGVVLYRGDAAKALQGSKLDVKELKRKAGLITMMGDEMRASAPHDVAKDFRTVFSAIKKSARALDEEGSTVRDVVDSILLNKANVRAFDRFDKYECH